MAGALPSLAPVRGFLMDGYGSRMIRVHVAVDHRLVRDAVSDALAREEGIALVESSAEGVTGTHIASVLRPDVIVVCDQAEVPPAEAVAEYREAAPDSKVVLLSIRHRAEDVIDGAGADAIVDAGDGIAELTAVIRRVAGGERN
jgi:DNA-binding NarL/FixJ family response regulator